MAVGLGLGISQLTWAAQFYHAANTNTARFQRYALVFALGLIASSVAKMAFWANNPIWPIMKGDNGGWNKTGIALAILACVRTGKRNPDIPNAGPSKVKSGSGMLPAFGLAGLMFGLHTLLCDSSMMILWVWDGFPVKGPLVVPHGVITIVAMSLGALASGQFPSSVLSSWPGFVAACIGAT